MSDTPAEGEQHEETVAYQLEVVEKSLIGGRGGGDRTVTEVNYVPESADAAHPEAIDRLKEVYDVEYPHNYGIYVADSVRMYCPECDGLVAENYDREEERWACPECSSTIYEDKGAYIDSLHSMVRFQKEHGYGPWHPDNQEVMES